MATKQPAATYALGLDFGTESVRAILVDTRTGNIAGESVVAYRHGVITEHLPGSAKRLPAEWALQHPGDYLAGMAKATKQAMLASNDPFTGDSTMKHYAAAENSKPEVVDLSLTGLPEQFRQRYYRIVEEPFVARLSHLVGCGPLVHIAKTVEVRINARQYNRTRG